MAGDNNRAPAGCVYRLRPLEADPMDGSGAADAPDGWYAPDRLTADTAPSDPIGGEYTVAPTATAMNRPKNEARIVCHLKSVLLAFRRDDQ